VEIVSLWCILLAALIGAPQGQGALCIRQTFAVVGFTAGRALGDDGWQEKIYNRRVSWEVVQGKDGPILHGTSDGSASMIYKDIEYNAQEHPLLRWQWKVIGLPRKGKENDRDNDDYGARVYIFFPGWTFLTSYVLEYVWDNEAAVGTVKTSPSSGRCKLIVVNSGAEELGKWISVERNLWDDYRRAFGWEPDRAVGGIGFMSDSDNTSSSAEAYYGPLTIGK
jgi:hypothetical protein